MTKPYNPDPSAPSNNLHHTSSGYRSEEEWSEEMFGRGDADVDHLGWYPGEQEAKAEEQQTRNGN